MFGSYLRINLWWDFSQARLSASANWRSASALDWLQDHVWELSPQTFCWSFVWAHVWEFPSHKFLLKFCSGRARARQRSALDWLQSSPQTFCLLNRAWWLGSCLGVKLPNMGLIIQMVQRVQEIRRIRGEAPKERNQFLGSMPSLSFLSSRRYSKICKNTVIAKKK